jgi:hypothetical protein
LFTTGGGDDSTTITNNSDLQTFIDSIIVEFDTSSYHQFDIGWIEKLGEKKSTRQFHTAEYITSESCKGSSVELTNYNKLSNSDKITFEPHQKVVIYSPHFSSSCLLIDVNVDCWEPSCFWGLKRTVTNFTGRIILVSNGTRDTLHLLCEKIDVTSSIKTNLLPHPKNFFSKEKSGAVNLMGQKINFSNNIDTRKSLTLKKENVIISTVLEYEIAH